MGREAREFIEREERFGSHQAYVAIRTGDVVVVRGLDARGVSIPLMRYPTLELARAVADAANTHFGGQ